MQRKVAATYVYDAEHDTITEYHDFLYKRVELIARYDGSKCRFYATDIKNNISIEIAKKSEEVFHDKSKHSYVVYLNTPDKKKAVQIISEYLINNIETDISYLEKRLSEAIARRMQYLNFRNKELKED